MCTSTNSKDNKQHSCTVHVYIGIIKPGLIYLTCENIYSTWTWSSNNPKRMGEGWGYSNII